jgi:hypothetical protein
MPEEMEDSKTVGIIRAKSRNLSGLPKHIEENWNSGNMEPIPEEFPRHVKP